MKGHRFRRGRSRWAAGVDSIDLPDVTYSFVFVPAVENPLLGEQFPAGPTG